MRTNYSWKAVEPILEMGNGNGNGNGKWEMGNEKDGGIPRVGVAHYAARCPILEPRPLVCTTGFIEKDDCFRFYEQLSNDCIT